MQEIIKMIEYESEYGQGDSCKYRVLDRNPKTGRLWHPPYCALSLDKDYKGKKCEHLGDEITLTITGRLNKHRIVTVNACDLGQEKQKKNIVDKVKGWFNIK